MQDRRKLRILHTEIGKFYRIYYVFEKCLVGSVSLGSIADTKQEDTAEETKVSLPARKMRLLAYTTSY